MRVLRLSPLLVFVVVSFLALSLQPSALGDTPVVSPVQEKIADWQKHFDLAAKYKSEKAYADGLCQLDLARTAAFSMSDYKLIEKTIAAQVDMYQTQVADLKTDSFLWKVPQNLLWHLLVIPLLVLFVGIFSSVSYLYSRFVKFKTDQVVVVLAVLSLLACFYSYTAMWTYVDSSMHIKEIQALELSGQILEGELVSLRKAKSK